MARRQLVAKAPAKYEFKNDEECETSPKYGGNHLVKPPYWPPRAQTKGDDDPYMALRCERCGSWCITHKSNDPEQTMIEVEIPEKPKKDKELVKA